MRIMNKCKLILIRFLNLHLEQILYIYIYILDE